MVEIELLWSSPTRNLISGVFIFWKYKKSKVPQWYENSYPKPYVVHFENLPLMWLVISLSFVKLLWPFVRYISYSHDQDHVHIFTICTIYQKIKYIRTHAHLDQGLWFVSPVDPVFYIAKHEKQVCLQILHNYSFTKTSLRCRMRKKGTIKVLVRNHTFWTIREIIWGTLRFIFGKNFIKPLHWW
jgi:hypothetical protein